ncbi:hypothetical protein ACFL0L_03415 [Patescibacteria group bacterium]
MVTCYRQGYPLPVGHNRFSLSRIVRFLPEGIFIAVEKDRVVGVLIGITAHDIAWFTALAVLPSVSSFERCSLLLGQAVGEQFRRLGYAQARFTTERRSVRRLADRIQAQSIIQEPDFFFDGKQRWVVTVDAASLPLITQLSRSR